MPPPKDSFIKINNATLAYTLSGPASGQLLITLHGGRGFGTHYSDHAAYAALAEDGYRVLSFTYRGHGSSSRTEPYTFRQIVEDVEALRVHFTAGNGAAGEGESRSIESVEKGGDNGNGSRSGKIVLIGGSFGGFLALQYAIEFPDNVSHLVLRGTAGSWHHEEEALSTLQQRLSAGLAPSMSVSMLRDKIFGSFASDDEFRLVMHAAAPLYVERENLDADKALERNLETVFNAEAHNALYAPSEKYFDYLADLGKITAKTLVIVGEHDWICPPEQSRVLAEGIRGARLVVVPGANHSVHLEKKEVVLGAIREILV
ncbi:hypothetical protein BDW74DRAFT_180344 [Aspergillus multicolor]|uniref:alpha/beta fold hydrolase n=1 Tax=Aspergillus multicolor TaxID=41759 RepID=UPI003CCE0A5A